MTRTCLRASAPLLIAVNILSAIGCRSPFYADKGAGIGALGGAGVGALVGNAVGSTAGGALIGAGVGALGGAVVGTALDDIQAQNRAEIAATLGRQVQAGAATPEEVIAMTRSGVSPALIANYVRTSGMARPLTANDVIYLHNNGVAGEVIQTMQAPPPAMGPTPMVAAAPAPIIVQEHYYPPPYWGPHYHCHRPGVSWGISIGR
jgi:uncharacterized protein YcfJ